MLKKNRTYHDSGVPIHGFKCQEHPLYQTWASMMTRCYNVNEASYKNYGGRGLEVDARWHHFKNFAEDMYPKPEGTSIDRRDNSKGYSKDNCRWATGSEQCFNRRIFSNNTSGNTGIKWKGELQWESVFNYEGKRYRVGVYTSKEEAIDARTKFIELFFQDRNLALSLMTQKDEKLWHTSSTKRRGVTPHLDGGFIARCTINGVRHYIGYFETIEEAHAARESFITAYRRDPNEAVQMIEERNTCARSNSSTKIRGVTEMRDGSFLVRYTINGVRHRIGRFHTLEEAKHARREFLEKQTQPA